MAAEKAGIMPQCQGTACGEGRVLDRNTELRRVRSSCGGVFARVAELERFQVSKVDGC